MFAQKVAYVRTLKEVIAAYAKPVIRDDSAPMMSTNVSLIELIVIETQNASILLEITHVVAKVATMVTVFPAFQEAVLNLTVPKTSSVFRRPLSTVSVRKDFGITIQPIASTMMSVKHLSVVMIANA